MSLFYTPPRLSVQPKTGLLSGPASLNHSKASADKSDLFDDVFFENLVGFCRDLLALELHLGGPGGIEAIDQERVFFKRNGL